MEPFVSDTVFCLFVCFKLLCNVNVLPLDRNELRQGRSNLVKVTPSITNWKPGILTRSPANMVGEGSAEQARIFVVNEFSFHFTKLYTL